MLHIRSKEDHVLRSLLAKRKINLSNRTLALTNVNIRYASNECESSKFVEWRRNGFFFHCQVERHGFFVQNSLIIAMRV